MYGYLRLLVAFALAGTSALQAQETLPDSGVLLHKLNLGAALLQRLQGVDELDAELASLQQDVQTGRGEDLPLRIDQLLIRIGERYRSRQGRADEWREKLRHQYQARKAELASFKEGYDLLLQESGTRDRPDLLRASYEQRLRRADALEAEGNLEAANAMLNAAYQQLLQAIKRLRDRQTIEYLISFDSPLDEFEYEQRRYRGQTMMLNMAMRERLPGPDVLARIRRGVEAASAKHEQATSAAGQGKYSEALQLQESATRELNALLGLVGIFF